MSASVLTFQQRQRERFAAAIEAVWGRDGGMHDDDLARLVRLVDAEQMSLGEAHGIVAELDSVTQPVRRAA